LDGLFLLFASLPMTSIGIAAMGHLGLRQRMEGMKAVLNSSLRSLLMDKMKRVSFPALTTVNFFTIAQT